MAEFPYSNEFYNNNENQYNPYEINLISHQILMGILMITIV